MVRSTLHVPNVETKCKDAISVYFSVPYYFLLVV